jgi:hypothetical protein
MNELDKLSKGTRHSIKTLLYIWKNYKTEQYLNSYSSMDTKNKYLWIYTHKHRIWERKGFKEKGVSYLVNTSQAQGG